jgi:NSS family neurotransmitter:Na+ symporter
MMSMGMIPWLNKLTFYKGQDFLTFIADMSDICLTVGGCIMCIFIGRRWGLANMDAELEQGNDAYMTSRVRNYLHLTIKWIAPILLGVLSVVIILEKFFGIENLF